MKAVRALFLLALPVLAFGHPGGALIAVDANTVIFGDPANKRIGKTKARFALPRSSEYVPTSDICPLNETAPR